MSAPYPRLRVENDMLIIDLVPAAAARRIGFEGVVDRTEFGDVVGIEILDFRQQLNGGTAPPSLGVDLPRWSYDDEIDAFYMRLTDATAAIQRSTIGKVTLDDANQMISLEIMRGP